MSTVTHSVPQSNGDGRHPGSSFTSLCVPEAQRRISSQDIILFCKNDSLSFTAEKRDWRPKLVAAYTCMSLIHFITSLRVC
ncbi:hypothetical protein PILCRDRAFT_673557 [Piloderma croceum F 1598]|uniref:Uncharacterized protein n=1 Tax=Piloderma croceum (strain F 1598) TaxID=765440 RepID=A0A0C3F667_PILCF|nr:hypothetical protein PILCRDRAFT_673557 [Piloderma croceum F 1598]